jgi:hypothetical protein
MGRVMRLVMYVVAVFRPNIKRLGRSRRSRSPSCLAAFLNSRFLGTFHHLVTLIPLVWAAAGSNRNGALDEYAIHLRLLFQTKSYDIAYW